MTWTLKYSGDYRRGIAAFTWGPGHETNPLLWCTILKNINRVIIDKSGRREFRPVWEWEKCKVQVLTDCDSLRIGSKRTVLDNITYW